MDKFENFHSRLNRKFRNIVLDYLLETFTVEKPKIIGRIENMRNLRIQENLYKKKIVGESQNKGKIQKKVTTLVKFGNFISEILK